MTDIESLDDLPSFAVESTTTKVVMSIDGAPDTRGKYHVKSVRPSKAVLVFEGAGNQPWNQHPRVRISLTGWQVRKDGSAGQNETTFLDGEFEVLPWMLEMIEIARPTTHPKADDEVIG
ncbi:hypothetical protein SEA_FLOAT294_9 [Gordonia phage Float294]|uniref:Uncharacterized protein n=1 Tax=Gordonia phage Skysand TaxID=2301559 RepID=A0A385DRH6_9CAUD|nr:hypothetical protein KNU08_gp09 [Gordonia phage Skysand]AXQ62043.1 hypothetical protein SEA_SKYSAND_9 [Gordonia phage Skysand]QXN74392.1 hypothetical protein SEA_FLOAT294_9 [Gordonia phage Float294]